MKRICGKAGVKAFGFHAIRHLSATVLYHNGKSLYYLQRFLRHKNPMTTQIYLQKLGLEPLREGLEEGFKRPGADNTAPPPAPGPENKNARVIQFPIKNPHGNQVSQRVSAVSTQSSQTVKTITYCNNWRPQGDLNPCRRRERPVSWTKLDDGDARYRLVVGRARLERATLCLKGRYSTD